MLRLRRIKCFGSAICCACCNLRITNAQLCINYKPLYAWQNLNHPPRQVPSKSIIKYWQQQLVAPIVGVDAATATAAATAAMAMPASAVGYLCAVCLSVLTVCLCVCCVCVCLFVCLPVCFVCWFIGTFAQFGS